MITVLRGKGSMKKVILKAQTKLKPKELKVLTEDFKKQWDEGFMVVPNNIKVELVDSDWIPVEKSPPQGEMVLIWAEHEDEETVSQTYGFGMYEGDGWVVYVTAATKILAWCPLPGPYKSE